MTTESPVAPLDRYQRQAATAPIGPVLILGGAGTGKTHTLAARIAIAVKGAEGPFSITCLTHSTGGGYAIQERVKRFLPEHASPGWFFAGTPQEFAMALLRSKGAQVLGMSPHFTVWPRSDAQDFIAFLLGANPRNRKRLHAEAGRILDWLWLNLAGYPDEPTPPDRPEWRGAVEKYQEEMRRQNAVDRGVVVPMVNRALEGDLEFRNTVRLERCRYLLVDDYQNITPAEYTMLRLLEGPERSLTIAVNPNECVRLRDGADDRLLEICRLDHPGMHQNTYSLGVAHRATPPLLEAKTRISNDPVLRHLKGEDNVTPRSAVRFGERWATPPPPALLEFEGRPADMYKYIFDGTQEFLPQGYAFEDIAVVFQDASILDQMRPLALSRGIPFTVLGVERQPRDRDVRCITGLLRSLLNPHDSAAFRNAACANPHLDRQWPDAEVMLRLLGMARDQHINLVQAARRQCDNPLMDADIRRDLQFFVDAWEHLDRMTQDPSTQVDDLCWQAVALLEEAQGSGTRVRTNPQIGVLLSVAQSFSSGSGSGLARDDPRRELRGFLDRFKPVIYDEPVPLEINQPFLPGRGLTFSTITAAQGLEWPIVWAVGASDHILPGGIASGDERLMREAQRLFYVWATRARDQLIFCHAIRSGPTQDAKPTRFLESIGDLLRHEVAPPPGPRR